MSASLVRAVHAPSAQVLAVWRAMPGAYLLLGQAAGPLPKSGSARPGVEGGVPGTFRSFVWSVGSDASVGFLTAVRLSDRTPVGEETEIVMRGARAADRDFRLRLVPVSAEENFGRQLAALAGSSAAALARFMLDLMRPEAEVDLQRPVALVQAFLHHVAVCEGCVELILELPKRSLLLQGWGPATGAEVELVVAGTSLVRHPAQSAEFLRNDIERPLIGSVLSLSPAAAAELAGAEAVFLLTREHVQCRRILDARPLDPASSAGQIRHLLPRLACPPELRLQLQQALLPRYEGVDTLNTSKRPVRAALDVGLFAPGAGVFLSGWLFDPTGQVTQVEYCDGTQSVRLDGDFVQIQRDDVVLAFKADSSLPASSRANVGFAVGTKLDAPLPERPYLRFTFINDEIAFLPLTLRDATEPSVRETVWKSIDMHRPSGVEVVHKHLAPFMLRAPVPHPAVTDVALQGPLDRRHSVVVPLRAPVQPRAIIAQFLQEPPASDEQIVFVCGGSWGLSDIERLIALVQFYDLPATILTLAQRAEPMEALMQAAARSRSETFMLLVAPAGCRTSGSRAALRDAVGPAAASCPTAIYEDGSIKFAGSTELEFTERPPFAQVQSGWLGLSLDHLESRDPARATGGTLDCCVLSREALPGVEAARRFGTRFGQEAALFSHLRDLGGEVLWLPTVVVAAADDIDPNPAGSVVTLVDNWMLRSIWGEPNCAS